MKTFRVTLFLVSVTVILATSCKTTKQSGTETSIDELVTMMTGSFNSAEQEAADSSYFNISLHMYPIWEGREGHWLYIEQAIFANQESPYRQRVYRVEQTSKNKFKTTVYALEDQDAAIGKWKTPEWFDQFDESFLNEREGCGVYLEKQKDGSYKGSTKKGECESTLRGASYATSVVSISPGQIYSWDQGFDANDEQVWGAVKGGYVFRKSKK
jgi:hypothetical protein